jgi:hypothetical protein
MSRIAVVFVVALLAGSVASHPATGQQDVAGRYVYTLQATGQGDPSSGVFTVAGGPGNWSGTLQAEGAAGVSLTSVEVRGNRITLTLDGGDQGVLVIDVTLEGTAISGTWRLAGEEGEVTGRKTG